MKICWKIYTRAIQDVDEFVSSSEQICINLALLPFKKPIQNKASGVMLNFLQICSSEETNSYTSEWPEGKYISANVNLFWWTIPLISVWLMN